jgi:Subtilase family
MISKDSGKTESPSDSHRKPGGRASDGPEPAYLLPGELLFQFEYPATQEIVPMANSDIVACLRRTTLDIGFSESQPATEPVVLSRGKNNIVLFRIQITSKLPYAISRINQFAGSLTIGDLTLQSAVPNWLVGANPKPVGIGGPTKTPKAATWADTPQDLKAFWGLLDPANVHVFVLDTLPGNKKDGLQFYEGIDQSRLNRFPMYSSLQPNAINPTSMTWSADIDGGLFDGLVEADGSPIFTIKGSSFPMADHGVFAAGIIKQHAPRATIHLVQVLNDYGISSYDSVLKAFSHVRAKAQSLKSSRIFVNCSFSLALPNSNKPINELGNSSLQGAGISPREAVQTLNATLDDLSNNGIQIVAAAGNDSTRGKKRGPGYPARHKQVLGVGALDDSNYLAYYSNKADTRSALGRVTKGRFLGMYTQALPIEDNTSGIVEWEGTSFACASVTGQLAQYAVDNPAVPAKQAKDKKPIV